MLVNKTIFSDNQGNELRLSKVVQAEEQAYFRNFSVKYVVDGKENYTINKRKFTLHQGDFVIGNTHADGKVLIDGSAPAKGICLDIAKECIADVINYHFEEPNTFFEFLFDRDCVIQKYDRHNSQLGTALYNLSNDFEDLINLNLNVTGEIFPSIAERVVFDQYSIFKNYRRLKVVRQETNCRLFNFINDAKNFIDDHYLEKLNIGKMASEAKLSEYHFIRLFKTVFHTTPYKYVIQKRLRFSIELMKNQYSVSDVSSILGFTDVPAFSNAFKQHFGCSPRNYQISNFLQ
ncbi:AraC family transcriptional regulator [Flavobacterium sp.]|uniref:helix-turn-helix domain-containing protein n=1 Tax=Flavobacterium sp. TaxID=239 RepID=UPI002630BA02|nr:AraC family transcriptional regulator [Flavobacterium sp.]